MSFQSDTSAGGYDDDISDDEIDRRMAAAGIAPKVPDAVSPAAPPSLAVQPAAPAGPQLPALPPPTVAGSAFDPAAPVIHAAPATSSLPALPPPTPAPTQPTAAPSIPTTDPSASTPTANPAKPAADSSLADIQAMIGGGSDDDAADDARSQYQSDETATNKYLRSQGAQMTVTPTGQTQPATDAQGNVLYKGAVIQPFTRLDDGNAYRVSRDQYGTQHYFDLSQGIDGQDYKTDPQTGDKYLTVSGADGGSKQEIIGQDPIVPVTNATKTLMQSHQDAREQAGQAVDQAQNGVAGATGYAGAPLSDLKQHQTALSQQVDDARDYLNQVDEYTKGGGTLNAVQHQQFWAATNTLNQLGPQADALANEIGTRQNTITAARQQRDASTSAFQEATYLKNRLSTPDGQTQVRADLGQVLAGGNIDPRRQAQYVSVGLLQPTQGQDGSQGFALSEQGQAVLSGQSRSPRQPQPATTVPAAASDLAQTTPASPQASSLPGSDSTSSTPATGQDSPVPSTATGAASPLVPGTTGASAQPTADPQNAQGAAGTPAAGQAPKPYSVGQDGSVKFDPANATASVLAAFKDGAIDGKTAEASLSNAKRVEAAHGDVASFLEAHPQIASAAQGLSTGGAFWAGGKLATLGATASGLNPAIAAGSVELGPFAWVPPAVAGAAEFIGGGTLAAWAKNKAENRLAEYSDAVKALQSGAKANPGTNTLANIAGGGLEGLSSLKNLASLGSLAAEGLGAGASTAEKFAAGATAIGKQAAAGAAGGAAVEGLVRPAVGYATDKALDAAGIQHDPTQAPTLGSIAETAGIGALLAGHPTEFGDITRNQMASILSRGAAHADLNVPPGEIIPPEQVAARYGGNPNVDSQALAHYGQPLSPAEQEIFFKAHARLDQLSQASKIDINQPFEGTGRQATRGGAPIDATSLSFRQTGGAQNVSADGTSTSPVPSLGAQIPDSPGYSPTPSTAPAVSPTPAAPAPAAAHAFPVPAGAISPGSPSPTAIPSAPAGQASTPAQPDDKANADAIAALTQARDNQQTLLDKSKTLSAEDRASVQGMVDHLNDRINALSAPAAPAAARAGIPGAPSPRTDDAPPARTSGDAANGVAVRAPAETGLPSAQIASSFQDSQSTPRAASPAAPTTAPVSGDQTASDPDGSSPAIRAEVPPSPQSSGPVPATADASGSAPSRLAPEPAPSAAAPSASEPQGSGNDEGKKATSPEDTTAPADRHQALSDMVNASASSDHGDRPPSTTFTVLSRIKARGGEVTPDLARNVSSQVTDILEDSGIGDEEKQSQLKQIVRDHLPAAVSTPTEKESSSGLPDEQSKQTDESFKSPLQQLPSNGLTVGGRDNASDAASVPTPRQPVTAAGKQAQAIIAHLSDLQSAGTDLNANQRAGLEEAQHVLDRDLNTQALGPNPQPTTTAGKRAQAHLLQIGRATVPATAGELENNKRMYRALQADFTAQRQALDVQGDTQGVAQPPSTIPGSSPVAPTPTRPRIVAPAEAGGDAPVVSAAREWLADQHAAGNFPSAYQMSSALKLPLPTARQLIMDQSDAENRAAARPSGTDPAAPNVPSAPTFKNGETVMFQGRPAVIEEIIGDKARIRIKAGPSPKNPNVNLVASRIPKISLSKLEKMPAKDAPSPSASSAEAAKQLETFHGLEGTGQSLEPAQVAQARQMRAALDEAGVPAHEQPPYLAAEAAETAKAQIAAMRPELQGLGVRNVAYRVTKAGSGIEFAPDGTMHVDPAKVAKSMTTVRDNQSKGKIDGTPEDWFSQVLHHESFHGVGNEVAKAQGFVDAHGNADPAAFYNSLPDDALPPDMDEKGRASYGAAWDKLPPWARKAEFVRMFLEGKYFGHITEAFYKFIRPIVDYFNRMASGTGVDPRFKEFVRPFEQRIEQAYSGEREGGGAPGPFKRPSRATVAKQTQLVRSLEAAANGNPDNADVVARYQDAAKQLAEMQRQKNLPLQPGETPRSFKMPTAQGEEDALDHVRNAGGLVSPGNAKLKPTYDPRQGDYDGAPTLGGFYHHAVYKSGGGMMPDRMAAILHENHGVGDGSIDGMWNAIGKAVDTRRAVATQMKEHAVAEKQAGRFTRDTSTPAKGTTEINVNSLNVGDHVEIGGQTLKVAAVDPDTLDVTLEDHSKYGVQQVADGQALYVEKVQPASNGSDDARLAAPRPDAVTGSLFGDDEPFELRGEAGTDAERVATARELAKPTESTPQLRPGEKGTGDLFQGSDQPFNLAGETGIDHAARQQEQEQQEREAAEAREAQYRAQGDLFNARPTEQGTRSMGQVPLRERETFAPPAPAEPLDAPAREEKPATDIADFGEKIGGARKDLARQLGPREKTETPAANAEQPAWQRKYVVTPETKRDYSMPGKAELKPTGKFLVKRADGVHVRTPTFDTAAQAEAAIPLIEAARNHAVSYTRQPNGGSDWHIFRKVGDHKRPVVKGGFASHDEATSYLATHPREVIEHKFAFPERPWLDRLERKGGTPRTGDVTPKMFQDAFGFRGGEFGNWNKGGDGQAALNHAYDALHDLSDILGVSPKALSLNGELAIAFGARGHGGADAGAAHYEPGHQVINLTKIKGAGSLAHEWFHALDHYLGRQDGKATDRTQAADARDASGRDPAYVRGEYASHGFSRQSGTREELRNAFKGVIDATAAKRGEFTMSSDKLSDLHAHQADALKSTLGSLRQNFTTMHEYGRTKKAATPEQLAEFDRLAGTIARGEVGEKINVPAKNGGRMSFGRMSYPPIEELNTLYKSVLGRSFATNDEGSQGKKLYWQIGSMLDAQRRVANAGEAGKETMSRPVATDFLREARKIDGQRASDYWSTPHEMGARSFESYVADKLENSDRKNDYLANGVDNRLYAMFGLKPYPEGEERATLNRAWQHVFDTIQEKPTARGSALHAAEPDTLSPGSERTPDPSRVESVKELVDGALTAKAPPRKLYSPLGTVSTEQAVQLKADTGLDLAGYKRNLDNYTVRHTFNSHGDPAREIARGNAPLTKEDFEKLPQVLASPDASIHAGKNAAGQDVILSAKRSNGYFIVAEEVRTKAGVLNVATMFKKSARPPAIDAATGATPLSTPEALRSTAQEILRQIASQHNFKHGGDSTLGAAEPKPSEKIPTTYEGVQGAKINRLRTAFSPDAGTLGIARADMPQVAAEHRGALANFLQARGIGWRNDDVLPGSLKPSQADYNPGKVEKARQWVGDSDRRILVSSDDHVIDGHHQWMGRLAGHPGETMPVVRLNAPARDILSQVHEFPSAGLEKAPDIGQRIAVPRQEGDSDRAATSREWIAKQRAQGIQPTPMEVTRATLLPLDRAKQLLEDQAREEAAADEPGSLTATQPERVPAGGDDLAVGDQIDPTKTGRLYTLTADGGKTVMLTNASGKTIKVARSLALKHRVERAATDGPSEGSTLAAAEPEAGEYQGLIDRVKGKLAAHNRQSTLEDAISAHHDAVDTMAGNDARHARNSIQQLDIPDALDRQAAGAAVEAGYDPRVLAEDLAKVQASPNKKLAAKYAPLYQRAIDNLPRLRTATEGYRQMDAEQDSLAERAGLTPSWQARTKHIYNDPAAPESTLPIDQGFGSTPGFKKAADAIAAGVDPRSIDLGELAGSRVYRNQRAINEKAFQDGLSTVTASDGKPLVEAIKENSSALNADGTMSHTVRVPAGYKAVQAGDNVLVAHKEIAQLLDALYGEDDWQNHFLGKHLLDLTALIKHGAIGIDLYHGFQTTTRSVLGFGIGPGGWKDARAGYDFADKDLDRAVQAGKITQAQADDARENRRIDEGLAAEGLNTGKASDNLLEAARQANLIEHIPVFGHAAKAVAELTFHRVQPIFMRQAARVAYARNKAANPQMSEQELFRKSSRETNEFYGNQGTQGFLKSKNMQNAARAVLFAPQFAFGRLKSELRGIGQAGKAVFDGVRGRGWRVGVVARALGGIVLANLIGTQMLNLFTRGHTTFQNPEDDHKLDAWIPGGPHNKGFFFSPLSIAAEYSHALLKYMDHRESAVDALAHIAGNKLSGGARALKTLATGQNYAGQPFGSMAERLKAAAGEMLPLPMQASPWITKNPKGTLGLSFGHGEKGSLEKQLLATAGLRVDAADSARNQMYALAEPFRSQQQPAGAHPPSAYADLRKALDNEDEDGARAEVQRLVTKGGKTLNDIAYHGVGLKDGKVHPELFTGSKAGDQKMVASLTPAQLQVWKHALNDRATDAHLLAHVLATMPTEQRRQVQLASAANARGNKGLSQTLGRSSAAAPAPTFQAQVGAPPTLPKFTGLPQAPTAGLFTGLSKPAGNP